MNDVISLFQNMLDHWAREGAPTPLLVAAGLALLGWLLPRAIFRLAGIGTRAIVRTVAVSGVLLVALGALASALLYALSGVQLAAAWSSDPLGGLVYFGATGAQLASVGLVIAALRSWALAARGAHRTAG